MARSFGGQVSKVMRAEVAASSGVSDEWCNHVKWSAVCKVFERLSKLIRLPRAEVRDRKAQQQAAIFPPAVVAHVEAGESLFPFMRLILPQLDVHTRPKYQMKEASIAEMFIKVHNLAPKSEHAERMRNYKDPSKAATGSKWGRKKTGSAPTVGDFAGVVYEVAYDRMTEGQYKVVDGRKVEIASDWDLARVNSWLDAVATATDGPERQALFTTLVRELPPTEQKWIIRVIMGDMKLGVKQESVLGWYHPDAMEAYHKVQNLKAVCEDRDLMDRSRRSRRSLAAGTPFSPMTAGKFVMDDSKPDFLSGWNDFFIEQKLDGERMVVHKVPSGRSGSGSGSGGGGDEIKIFSRQSIDNSLYASVMRGHFNKALAAASEVVLDGEMMAWDTTAEKFVAFGNTITVAKEMADKATGASSAATARHLSYYAFDMVWVRGWKAHPELDGDLTLMTLDKRRQLLTEFLAPVGMFVATLPAHRMVASTAALRKAAVVQKFEAAIDRGEEGIMLKKASSLYECGNRSSEWLKVKPEYSEGAFKTFDFVVVGGYYGEGVRRAGAPSHFLLAVIDNSDVASASAGGEGSGLPITHVRTVARVGSGYNLDELADVLKALKPHWRPVPKAVHGARQPPLPAWILPWVPKKVDIPDILVDDPNNGLVVEVKGAQVIPNDTFSAGYTIRFVRVHRFRNDLHPRDACTWGGFKEFYASSGGTMTIRSADGAGYGDGGKARAKRRAGTAWKKQRIDEGGRSKPGFTKDQEWAEGVVEEVEVPLLGGAHVLVLGHPYGDKDVDLPEEYRDRNAIQRLVLRLGGVPDGFRSVDTKFAVGVVADMSASNVTKSCTVGGVTFAPMDAVRPQWLIDSLREERLLDLEPEYVLKATPGTQRALSKVVDRFGDHQTRKLSEEAFISTLKRMPAPRASATRGGAGVSTASAVSLSAAAVLGEWEEEDVAALTCGNPDWLFRGLAPGISRSPGLVGCVAYFDVYEVVRTSALAHVVTPPIPLHPLSIPLRMFQLYRGVDVPLLDKRVNVVFVDLGDTSRVAAIRDQLLALGLSATPILSPAWITDSIQARELQPLLEYEVY